jgi:hypothetical protein
MMEDELIMRDVWNDTPNLERYIREAGFVDTKAVHRTVDIGDWRAGAPPELKETRILMERTFTSPIPALVTRLQSTYPDIIDDEFCGKVMKDQRENVFKLYGTM